MRYNLRRDVDAVRDNEVHPPIGGDDVHKCAAMLGSLVSPLQPCAYWASFIEGLSRVRVIAKSRKADSSWRKESKMETR